MSDVIKDFVVAPGFKGDEAAAKKVADLAAKTEAGITKTTINEGDTTRPSPAGPRAPSSAAMTTAPRRSSGRCSSRSPATVTDAGPLDNARYIEPACFLLVRLAYGPGFGGRLGLTLERG